MKYIMKILFLNEWMHPKNMNALMKYNSVEWTIINNINKLNDYDLSTFNCIYSSGSPIDVSNFKGIKFLFGPHFSVFPDERLNLIKSNSTGYIILSTWVKNCWNQFPICHDLKLLDIPFGVDTNKFREITPLPKREKIFVYFKSRNPEELKVIESILKNNNLNQYTIFNYQEKYDEQDYLHFLQQSKFGIWIGTHESQGFALEEALSCNVPLLVWDVQSMNQEFGQKYTNIPATSIPYWDIRCGEYFHYLSELEIKFDWFLSNIENYKPREYVLENLSIEVCEKKWIDSINKL